MSPAVKHCAVCGDKALGFNFNAVTCESCKAFFRRNALAKKQFTCPFSQNCEITVVTRRFCQKCRLKKCLDIGMKSENIMSEEDKLIKRRKIETNRAKRRMTEQKENDDDKEPEEKQSLVAADSSGNFEGYSGSYDSQSCGSIDSANGAVGGQIVQPSCSSTHSFAERIPDVNPELMTGEEMVEFIVCDPDRASQAISRVMRTPKEALASLEKIINSQKDALRLISHLISYPGDALKIISKLMNSPFNALTVFTKFMSSPTDALEIISKIVSSPQDVLLFIKNLMQSPEDGLDIMNKFMNTPAEALKMLNKIFNGTNLSADQSEPLQTDASCESELSNVTPERSDTVIQSMLNNSPSNSFLSTIGSPAVPPLNDAQSPPNYNYQTPSTSPGSNYAHTSPISVGDFHYHSPTTSQQNDELPSTSTTTPLSSHYSPQLHITNSADVDMKSFMQTNFDENTIGDMGINSLESVLTEVIRIEYQAFNNVTQNPRVKQEQHQHQHQFGPTAAVGIQPMYDSSTDRGYTGCSTPQPPVCAPSSVIMERDLNAAEQMKLRELKIASEALYYPVDDDLSVLMMGDDRIKPEDARQNPKLLQVINLTAVAIKRLIKMAKKITAFRNMCQEDQVALLKGGCTEMMLMRSVMNYDGDRNTWKIPHTEEGMSNIRADVLKFAKGNVYEEHLKFISTFDEKWRLDENIILIVCAIVLFTPSRPRIIHKDVIRLEQHSYYYLLRRYLESVYPGCEAKNAYIKLIQKISDVERLNKFIIGVYLNVNPSQVEPLLREIFDLKNH